jgi:hypothetical protein
VLELVDLVLIRINHFQDTVDDCLTGEWAMSGRREGRGAYRDRADSQQVGRHLPRSARSTVAGEYAL